MRDPMLGDDRLLELFFEHEIGEFKPVYLPITKADVKRAIKALKEKRKKYVCEAAGHRAGHLDSPWSRTCNREERLHREAIERFEKLLEVLR